MTLFTNGDFDQTLELSERLMTVAAGTTLPVTSPAQKIQQPNFTANVSATTEIKAIWFRERPQPWATSSGYGTLKRNTSDVVTLALEVAVHIDLLKVVMEIAGHVQSVDLTSDSKYDPIRPIDFTAYVEVTDHVEVQTLDYVTDREAPQATISIPCVLIDFNTALGYPSNWPRVEVKIKPSDVQKNKAVMLLMAAAEIRDGQGGGDAALAGLIQNLSDTLRESIVDILQSLTTWRTAGTGRALLYPGTPSYPDEMDQKRPVKNLGVKTLDGSLFIGVDYLAKRGNTVGVTTTTLRGRGRPDDLGTTVSNRLLLRGVIRTALMKKFGLMPSDFNGGEFCALRGPVKNVNLGGGQMGTIDSLVAFVNNSSQIQILLQLTADAGPGVTAHASLDLHLALGISRQVSGPHQALRMTATLANPNTAIVSKNVDVAWWWYVIGTVIAPGVGTAIVGIFDGIVFELMESGSLAGAIGGFAPTPTDNPAPLPVTLVAPRLELNDANATPMPTALGAMLAMVFGARGHDLYVGARFAKLPDPLSVDFQIPDSADPGGRLDGVGGMLPDSSEWALEIDDAIALVEAGHKLQVTVPPAPTVDVITAVGPKGIPHLRTTKDDFGENNLANLPKRIPAAGSVLGPTP